MKNFNNKLCCVLMGVLNITPDSFSDGGRFYSRGELDLEKILSEAERMMHNGAHILDIGGESSGPDSKNVSLEEELRRVIPVLIALRRRWLHDGPIFSIDTYKSEVARQAINLGAKMINDVTALRGDPNMVKIIAESGVDVVLMYSKDSSARTTREAVQYRDVIATIKVFFEERIASAEKNGVNRSQIILDPGMGFFVSGDPKYSFEILDRLDEFQIFKLPILIGPSRKSFLGGSIKDRLTGTIAACQKAVLKGAQILRVHDIDPISTCRQQKPASRWSPQEERIVELL